MLTPLQIGALAEHIREAIFNHPSPQPDTKKELPEEVDPDAEIKMEEWEVELQNLINTDARLPSYDRIQKDDTEILETLIYYYDDRIERIKNSPH